MRGIFTLALFLAIFNMSTFSVSNARAQFQPQSQSNPQEKALPKPKKSGDVVAYNRDLITRKSSTVSEIGIAFMKLSNNYPDLTKIISESKGYTNLANDPVAQQAYLLRESEKLQASYLAFLPKKSSLVTRFAVKVEYKQDKKLGSTLVVKTNNEKKVPLYLPVNFNHYPIAMLFDQIELFQTIPLSMNEERMVIARMPMDGALTLLLEVFPIASDDKHPITYDGLPQYPLLTRIGYIGLINNRGEQVWAWASGKKSGNSTIVTPSAPLSQQIPKMSNAVQ